MRAGLSTGWVLDRRRYAASRRMVVRSAPGGARRSRNLHGPREELPVLQAPAAGRCRATSRRSRFAGCPRKRRLKPGARITVVVSATGFVTRTFTVHDRPQRGARVRDDAAARPAPTQELLVLMRRLLALLAGAAWPASSRRRSRAPATSRSRAPTIVFEPDNADDIDQIAGIETPTSIRFTRFGGASIGPGPAAATSFDDTDTIDCPRRASPGSSCGLERRRRRRRRIARRSRSP